MKMKKLKNRQLIFLLINITYLSIDFVKEINKIWFLESQTRKFNVKNHTFIYSEQNIKITIYCLR